ncbi:Uncharacterized protein L662 [Exaiptasia diaphana]|nr:Uncharacterized protein L662 [Exaiptasia diaphana]
MAGEVKGDLTLKHIVLSNDRPALTDPQKIFADWNHAESPRHDSTGTLTRTDASSVLGYNVKEYETKKQRETQKFAKYGWKYREVVQDRRAVLGSSDKVYSKHNVGFFESVQMAYNNHYNLGTSADDWWFCVIRRIAVAIDLNCANPSVRKTFVDHEGKKDLEVDVPDWPLTDVNYSSFFDEISKLISANVKVPNYVDTMTADFSTTTAVQKMVSQITLMSSVQEFFAYSLCGGCGIPAIEMLGCEEDWQKLLPKLRSLKKVLEPINEDLQLTDQWWALAEKIFTKLLETYRGSPDREWWSHIMTYNEPFGSGGYIAGIIPGYSGWVVEFLEGKVGHDLYEFSSGLVAVPMKVVDIGRGIDTMTAIAAGMVGFTVHEAIGNNRPSIRPFQGWALMLPPNSIFYKEICREEKESTKASKPDAKKKRLLKRLSK